MMRALAASLAVFALPLQAAELAHCYTGEAPPDAEVITATPAPMSGFREVLAIAAARRACGAGTDVDVVNAFLANAGCSPASEIAAFSRGYLEAPEADIASELKSVMGLDDAGMAQLCETLETCEPAESNAYSEQCIAAFVEATRG